MLLEDLVILVFALVATALIGRPLYKLYRRIVPAKRDRVAEARERLEVAKQDAEAARLNREAEDLYQRMVDEAESDEERIRREQSK